jgi:multidrug efflux pump subunit AcrA (membrane-fusion protein)
MKIIVNLVILSLFLACSRRQGQTLPVEQNLTESVYASVTIQPDSLYQAYSIVPGILDKNLVEEGDLVLKNQALLQIVNSTPKLNSENAKLALDLAKENYNGSAAILSSIEDEILAATLNFKNDSVNYFRQKNLWNQSIGSKIQYDTKKLAYELSSNELKLLKSKYNRTKKELETILKQAQNNYQVSLISTNNFSVESKINGKIYALYKESGEIVNTNEPLASIGSATNFIIEMLVDEVDIVRIAKNQKVVINLDAYRGDIFTGAISKIYPKKNKQNQTFVVEAIFNETPNVLYPGLSGEANIIIAKKDKILTIPKTYIIDNNKVMTDSGLITITTGLENMEFIEVLSGIDSKTYIYKSE